MLRAYSNPAATFVCTTRGLDQSLHARAIGKIRSTGIATSKTFDELLREPPEGSQTAILEGLGFDSVGNNHTRAVARYEFKAGNRVKRRIFEPRHPV